jgi:hypothetical protein
MSSAGIRFLGATVLASENEEGTGYEIEIDISIPREARQPWF